MGSQIQLTAHQHAALSAIQTFVEGSGDCFVLQGGTGTGKTRLIFALPSWLKSEWRSQTCIFSIVGAARILGNTMDTKTGTIHIVRFAFSSRPSHA